MHKCLVYFLLFFRLQRPTGRTHDGEILAITYDAMLRPVTHKLMNEHETTPEALLPL